jgi:glucans biosynthesis protein
LVQIPTPDETNDNIVAFWVPQASAVPGKPFEIAYRIRWQSAGTAPAGVGWTVQTRRGRGFVKRADGDINYVVDFDGPALRALAPSADIEPVIWVDANAEVRERNLFKNPVTGAWRMTVRFKRNDAARPVELRAYLKQQQSILTETWSYILPAEADKP